MTLSNVENTICRSILSLKWTATKMSKNVIIASYSLSYFMRACCVCTENKASAEKMNEMMCKVKTCRIRGRSSSQK